MRLSSLVLVMVGASAGCAGPAVLQPSVESVVDPRGATAIRLTVVDQRTFVAGNASPEEQSAGEERVLDGGERERTVGRRQPSPAHKGRDYVLPVGRDVAGVVREAATTVFRRAGFSVRDDAPHEVVLVINRFWIWSVRSVVRRRLAFELQLEVRPSIKEARPSVVAFTIKPSAYKALTNPSKWEATLNKGLRYMDRHLTREAKKLWRAFAEATE